ncbi:MAG: hypothetical protein ABI687_02785 [Flavitalea sp.]
MTTHHQKKIAGIWLDSAKAMIIAQDEKGEFIIFNNLKGRENHSGGNEHTINNAKKSEELKYFKSVSALLLPYDEILIFGPGTAQEQLQHHLKETVQFNDKKVTIDSAPQMTDNQAIAWVREFFKS